MANKKKSYSGRSGAATMKGYGTVNTTGSSSTRVRSGAKSQKEYISLSRTSSGNNKLYGMSRSFLDKRNK